MKDLHTFGELIRENKIVIPKIQRDYVQGSNAQQEKRDEFLAVLLDHLVSDKEYHLDFIYGTGGTDQGEFLPLDGQQRLTTIFLIHWVLSQRSGIRDIEVKDYFSYQTRRSSELFCQKLIEESELISAASQKVRPFWNISEKKLLGISSNGILTPRFRQCLI